MKDAIVKSFDSFDVRSKILVCVTKCLTEDELRETWRNYRNDFAVEFQTDDIDEFERWNFYLFYVVDNKNAIDRSLKYEIEHDTISSRKIVVSKDELQDLMLWSFASPNQSKEFLSISRKTSRLTKNKEARLSFITRISQNCQ